MITKDEIQELLHSTETYRVERTTSTGDMDKFQEAICAFANDNGGNVGGNIGGKDGGDVVENIAENVVENIVDVPSFVPSYVPSLSQVLSQALSQVDKRWQSWAQKKQPPVQRLQLRMKRLQVRHSQSSTAATQTAAME